jgi:hypothetical protein
MLPIIILVVSVLFFALFFGRLADMWPPQTADSIDSQSRVMAAPGEVGRKTRPAARSGGARTAMQVLISLILLAGALYTILSGSYDGDHEKWAYGAMGTIVGFWLKG